MVLTRQILEKNEEASLALYAIKSRESLGRKFEEKIDDERLCFQRDKDRIIHSKSFRRLEEKTQVFIAGSGDHYRTRLTHTLEVAQVARDIARRLALNEDLCEAIALAHDLGHPPYGHGGESALDEIMQEYGGHFEHNQQSRRIVEKIEKVYPDFYGMNLSFEVLDGLIKHQSAWDQAEAKFETSPHLEAQVVNIADEIAYTNHDIDDGLRSGIIMLDQLKGFYLWDAAVTEVQKKYGKNLSEEVMKARTVSRIISMMIRDFCEQTEKNITDNGIQSVEDVRKYKGLLACFSQKMQPEIKELRDFLYDNFYMSERISTFINDGQMMIKELFRFYIAHPDKFPKEVSGSENIYIVAVKDYIAGMTDGFLQEEFSRLVGK